MRQIVLYKFTNEQASVQELSSTATKAKQLSGDYAPILLVPSLSSIPEGIEFNKKQKLAIISGVRLRVLSVKQLSESMISDDVILVWNVAAKELSFKLEQAKAVLYLGKQNTELEIWLTSREALSIDTDEPLSCPNPSSLTKKALDWLHATCNLTSNFTHPFDEDRLKVVANTLYEVGECVNEAAIVHYCKTKNWQEQPIYTCIAAFRKAQTTKLKVEGSYNKETLFSMWGINPEDMQDKSYIKSFMLESMWGYKTVEWNNINEDVNILVGINGVGKTTLLDAIYSHYTGIKNGSKAKIRESDPAGNQALPISYIRTADTPALAKSGKESRLTQELNGVIMQNKLGNSFYNYFMRQLYESSENVKTIKDNTEELFGVINEFFKETGKKIEVDKTNNSYLSFRTDDRDELINHTQLSSGEKQLLLILIKVFLQEKQPAILLMDEPEQSLHIRWQQYLIEAIRKLNPNCQLILTTHSPSILSMGWSDKIVYMDNIVK